jgi:hypothetical protein
MDRIVARATALLLACSMLTGCGTVGGKIAGGLALAAAATVANAALRPSGHRERSQGEKDLPAPPPRGDSTIGAAPVFAAETQAPHDTDPTSCAAKRREFRAVYGSSRRLPAQLECAADGDFGAPAVYGSRMAAQATDADD